MGILIFIGLGAVFLFLPDVVKIAGTPFLFLPARLGFYDPVRAEEIQAVDLARPDAQVVFPVPGPYAVYASDLKLLQITDTVVSTGKQPWLKMVSQSSGTPIKMEFVERGLRPYDPIQVKGRPVYRFEIAEAGVYDLSYPQEYATVSILPDTIRSGEKTLAWAILLQVGLIAAVPGWLLFRRYRAADKRRKVEQAAGRVRSDQFWEAEKRRRS